MDNPGIKITLRYEVKKNNLTLNGLLGVRLERNRDEVMRKLAVANFQTLAKKAKEEYSLKGCVRDGHQNNQRLFRTSCGEIRYRLAQKVEATTGQKRAKPSSPRRRFTRWRPSAFGVCC